jgi:hypothetical protein
MTRGRLRRYLTLGRNGRAVIVMLVSLPRLSVAPHDLS